MAATLDPSSILGRVGAERFLADFWQRRPLLVRQAIPDFAAPVAAERLFELAQRDDVEARLVTAFEGTWRLTHAPLEKMPRRKSDWTLLVQGMNFHEPVIDDLLQSFSFLPYTRLDDVMVSFATPHGSVGPHYDSYDVFLLQAHGRRRWRISSQDDLELREDVPLKLLKRFEASEEWVLEPGDMLYLPPHIAHEGVALDNCMTYSIGFRAPSFEELGREFLLSLAETLQLSGRVHDAGRAPARHPAQIDTALVRQVAAALAEIHWTDADVALFIGRYLSEPKPSVFFEAPRHTTPARFGAWARREGVRLDPKTRMLYQGRRIYINGEDLEATPAFARDWLARLADRRGASPAECERAIADAALAAQLYDWYSSGWILRGEKHRD